MKRNIIMWIAGFMLVVSSLMGAEASVGANLDDVVNRLDALEGMVYVFLELMAFCVGLMFWRLALISMSRRNLF